MLASSGEMTAPCPVPISLMVTTPSSRTPALSHFWIMRITRPSPIRCSTHVMTLSRPHLTDGPDPIFENARLEPFLDQADPPWVADPVLPELDDPCLAHRVEE